MAGTVPGPTMEANPPPASGYSSQKQRILEILKRAPRATLAELAAELKVSKVAALRHVASLEEAGLVERFTEPAPSGRPPVRFRLRPEASHLFPEAYTEMSLSALQFVEREMGREAVVRLLQERTREIENREGPRFRALPLSDRVRELAKVRERGGYMAEVGARAGRSQELLEHNCPILAITQKFPEACEVERRMFESLLKAKVETTHRVVAGNPVCRFLIRPKEAPAP
jgi:predicted ArsR family transcriptional regulator